MRTVYGGVGDLRRLMPDLTDGEIARTDFGAYSREQFYDDMGRVTQYRTDPDLAERLIDSSFETLCWMRDKGVRFLPLYGRQSFEVDGKVRFWGGLTVEAWGGGPGLVDALTEIATAAGVDVRYGVRATALATTARGLEVHSGSEVIRGDAVVLACGGFESNPAWRTRYLGQGWDLAKVRGTRFNTGDGIRMAVEVGAATRGNYSGCHAVGWDMNAPEFGDLDVGDNFQKHSYPFGVMVNSGGERFVDEGADFRNYTYARYGREVLNQPGQCAWQIFDAKVSHLLRDEYRIRRVTKVTADTLEALAAKMEGVDSDGLVAEIARYNAAVDTSTPFDPNGQGRPRHARLAGGQIQLGQSPGHAAVRGLWRHLRDHVHVRRPRRRPGGARDERRGCADPGSLCCGRIGRRAVLLQLSGGNGAHVGCGVRTRSRAQCGSWRPVAAREEGLRRTPRADERQSSVVDVDLVSDHPSAGRHRIRPMERVREGRPGTHGD